jgi:hypothetical protein
VAVVSYAPFVDYDNPLDYLRHYERIYCSGPIKTFDGIWVRFRKSRFRHDFYESTRRNRVKDQFSTERARRIDWIKKVLQDSNAELYQGWDKKNKRHDPKSRVALVVDGYVVVIRLTGPNKADFVTAYVPGKKPTGRQKVSTLDRIKSGPKWA